jgi:hypothetical protein
MGHLDCLQILAIVNGAAINMGVQVALSYPGAHSFRYRLGVLSVDHMVVLFLAL